MAKKKTYLYAGIDPGKLGGVAIVAVQFPLKATTLVYQETTPLLTVDGARRKSKKTKAKSHKVYDMDGLLLIAKDLAGCQAAVLIEDQWPRPFDSRVAAHDNGMGYGYWLMALKSVGIVPKKIAPATWKAGYCESGKGKEESITVCKKLWTGQIDGEERLKDGLAEAILIADYNYRTNQKIKLPLQKPNGEEWD